MTTQTKDTETKKTDQTGKLTLVADKSKSKIGILHYAAVGIWLGWMGFYFYLPISFPLMWYFCPNLLYAIIILLVTSAFYPINEKYQPQWTKTFAKWIMQKGEEYFQMRVYCEDYEGFLKAGPCIIALEPHDILPLSLFIFSDYLGYFKPHINRGCITSAVFQVPGMRHLYSWTSATSVSKRNIQRLLRRGVTTTICPGGAQEVTYMTSSDAKECVLYLRSRLGLIKLAAEFGVPVVPTFTFNQRPAFDFWVPQWRWLHKLGKKIGFIPLVIFGVFGIPFAQPKPVPMTMVMGKPIPIPKMTPDELKDKKEVLEKYNREVIETIERIYENHKDQFGMGDIKLIIK